ncbi:Inner membrane protein YabI [Zhongshania aliphaticivorans]|uniref:Inner membrane protein YabI n=1 Tax=Zhongshania aliphaticivorans TaxID=1470434 RepID=A0A5S9MTY1_9GAMM|nr:DedA family protein [Zhongshania aliphaticivorans]CAA0080774.1 Inner membrane protein YabI [Zhongshania aliphaticivorans]CAA0085504.1 Inner membrane protein YabI [Zhongshania aliphaticivorans]
MTDTLTSMLLNNPQYALAIVFLNALCEATVLLGLFVPGAVLVVVTTFIFSQGIASLTEITTAAFFGALLADNVGFHLGRLLGPSFHESRFALRYTSSLHKAENLIQRYGWGAILLGRLLTAIRSIVPLLTGISGFPAWRYFIFDIIACAIWAIGLGLIITGVDNVIN